MFRSELELTRDGKQWRLTEPLVYEHEDELIEVPSGFRTDLDSVPRLPVAYMWLKNRATKSAVVHDFLYVDEGYRRRGRRWADQVFLAAMADEGVRSWRRYPIYWAVRAAGWLVYRRKSGA